MLSFLVPVAMRLYRRSVRGRNQGTPGQYGQFPGNRNNPGNQRTSRGTATRSRTTLAASASWAPQAAGTGQPAVPRPAVPRRAVPNAQYPDARFPDQPFPSQPYPGQHYPGPAGYQSPVPYEDSPEYLNNPPQPQRHQPAPARTVAGPARTPPPPSAAQGYRARKLAELDQQYSDGKMSMEDYMAQRADIKLDLKG